jgi:hypothetical protein
MAQDHPAQIIILGEISTAIASNYRDRRTGLSLPL